MNRRAFTLIELLAVVAIISLLIMMLLPAVQKVRESAARMQTQSGLMQLTLAVHNCNDVHGQMPPATGWFAGIAEPKRTTVGGIPATLHFHLLPFVEQQNVYRQALAGKLLPVKAGEGEEPAGGAGGGAEAADKNSMAAVTVPLYISPLDPTAPSGGGPITSYAANLRVFSDLGLDTKWNAAISPGPGGVDPKTGLPWVYGSAKLTESIPDGTSNTLAFTTRNARCAGGDTFFFNPADMPEHSPFFAFDAPKNPPTHGPVKDGEVFQINPTQIDCSARYTPQSMSIGGLMVARCDGAVRLIKNTVSARTWGLLVQPNDDMPIPGDWE